MVFPGKVGLNLDFVLLVLIVTQALLNLLFDLHQLFLAEHGLEGVLDLLDVCQESFLVHHLLVLVDVAIIFIVAASCFYLTKKARVELLGGVFVANWHSLFLQVLQLSFFEAAVVVDLVALNVLLLLDFQLLLNLVFEV